MIIMHIFKLAPSLLFLEESGRRPEKYPGYEATKYFHFNTTISFDAGKHFHFHTKI